MKMRKKLFSGMVLLSFFFNSCSKKTTPAATTNNAAVETPVVMKKDISAEGKALFDAKCGKCHGLPDPVQYTSQEWRPIMQKMGDKARLTQEERSMVLTYVMKNAKSGK